MPNKPVSVFRGDRLREFRERLNLTQEDLQKRIGAQKGTLIYRLESGRAEPGLYFLRNLARELGVSIEYLLGVEDDPTPLSEIKKAANLAPQEISLLRTFRAKGALGVAEAMLDNLREAMGDHTP